ncbi:MAG TPA: DUF4097 family beta strand repeat-containing protein [Steroidobacteraceae bacterium]|nr:DUF4097 family beta strand repeat-containing protein [Steroidobacteraceae bacterium]
MTSWTRKAAMALIGISAAAPVLADDTSFDRHFSVSPGGELTLDTDVGSVVIVGRDGHELDVHATVSGSADFLGHFSIMAVQGPQGVTVTGRMQRLGWLGEWFESGRHRVTYTIELPRDYVTDIRTSGGSLDLRHLSASTQGRTSGGSVTVDDVHGEVRMRTSGGRIEASELAGPADLRTSGGSIDVSGCTGDLTARTSGGSIRLERIDGSVQAYTSGGSVTAEVRSNRGVSLATSGGSIALLLPANAVGSLDAHTDGGRVESTIPLSSVVIASRNELRGAINGGGQQILLRTSGGSIRVGALD